MIDMPKNIFKIFFIVIIFIFFLISGQPALAVFANKFIASYNFADSDISTIASNFSIMDTSLDKASQVQQIKNLNPNFKAVFYRDALTFQQGATENWYVHDAQTGSRVENKDWGWILMDISNPDYQNAIANYLKNQLDSHTMFDGVFLDDVWKTMSSDSFYRAGTTQQAVLPQSYIDTFHVNMVNMIAKVKSTISPKMLILNTSDYDNADYLAAADGIMYEAFGHANWQTFAEWYASWWGHLDDMIDISKSNKIYLAQSGIMDGATEAQITQTERYCFTLFLLGANENTYFYFKPTMSYQGVTLYPEWSKDIGEPLGDYSVRSSYVLQREFSKALVIVNSGAISTTIDLGKSYKNLDGNIVSSITLASRQGEILEKIETPDTTPPAGSILINGGAAYTTNLNVILTLSATDADSGVSQMRFSNDGVSWTTWEPYATSKSWILTPGSGIKTVYVQYRDNASNSSGSFSDTILLTMNIVDFDGDGKTDILWRYVSSGQTAVWLMNGSTYSIGSPGTASNLNWQIKGMGDFDGDGKSDILWQDTSSGWTSIWFMNGASVASSAFPGIVDLSWQIKGVGDFNGDGKADILWQDSTSGWVAIWFMGGATITSTGAVAQVNDPTWQIKKVADFNGDGRTDILWQNTTTGWTYIWFMDGATITSGGAPAQVGDPNWQIKCVGYFNGDGKADVFWQHTTTGWTYIWFMDGATISFTGVPAQVGDPSWEIMN